MDPTSAPTAQLEHQNLNMQADSKIQANASPQELVSVSQAESNVAKDDEYPPLRKLVLILPSVYLSMFLVALDRTILGTAIPKITDEFHSIDDVGWYASAYLLTSSCFQLLYGRIYTLYNPKWVLLSAISIFEVGSLICAIAPTSNSFIIGRAIAGLGSAGIFGGVISIIIVTVPLRKRPVFNGIFGAVFGFAAVAGPLVGGVFTTYVTWRWCFYINLPIGGVVTIILLFLLKIPPRNDTQTLREKIMNLDPYGTLVFLPGLVCLLLALEWGGTTYSWTNARIIVLFILAGILLSLFVYIESRLGDRATVPIRIIKQRSVATGLYFSFLLPSAMVALVYYLPLWFQAIKGVNAIQSGIDTLPLILALIVGSIIAGGLTNRTGYYVPQVIASTVILSIGAGLVTTFTINTGHARWIGYQVICGFGLGLGMQQGSMAAQTCLPKKDAMIGSNLMMFAQSLGGSIWITIASLIFDSSLVKNLKPLGLNSAQILGTGAIELRTLVPASQLQEVLVAYNGALQHTFILSASLAAATFFCGFTMEWKSVKASKSAEAEVAQGNKENTQEAQMFTSKDQTIYGASGAGAETQAKDFSGGHASEADEDAIESVLPMEEEKEANVRIQEEEKEEEEEAKGPPKVMYTEQGKRRFPLA